MLPCTIYSRSSSLNPVTPIASTRIPNDYRGCYIISIYELIDSGVLLITLHIEMGSYPELINIQEYFLIWIELDDTT